jgi:hypothetical protein
MTLAGRRNSNRLMTMMRSSHTRPAAGSQIIAAALASRPGDVPKRVAERSRVPIAISIAAAQTRKIPQDAAYRFVENTLIISLCRMAQLSHFAKVVWANYLENRCERHWAMGFCGC